MTIIENIGLLKTIFTSPKVVPGLSRLQLFTITKHYGLGHLYVGNRINHEIEFRSMTEEEALPERSGRTLFFHDKGDSYYYDVLDENTRCMVQREGLTVANHVCTEVKDLKDCLKIKQKKIGGIK